MCAFWLDEEPYCFSNFKGIANKLNAPDWDKKLPINVKVNTPWGTREVLRIIAIERDHMESGDFLAECELGKKKRELHIWWNEEAEVAEVENSVDLLDALAYFAERWDVLPPASQDVGGWEIHILGELGFRPAYDLAEILQDGDPDDELGIVCAVYGETAEGVLRKGLSGFSELSTKDANGEPITKLVMPLLNATEFYDIFSYLQEVNDQAEITLDVSVLENDTQE